MKREQELLDEIMPLSVGDGYAESVELVKNMNVAFNSYVTSTYTVPEHWTRGKGKNFFVAYAYVLIKYMATQEGTWDERKQIAAKICSSIYKELGDRFTQFAEIPTVSDSSGVIRAYTTEDGKRADNYWYHIYREISSSHGTILTQEVSFFLRYLYKYDNTFKKVGQRLIEEGLVADENFYIMMR